MSLPDVEAAGWANAVGASWAGEMILRSEDPGEVLAGKAIVVATAKARAELMSRSGGLSRA